MTEFILNGVSLRQAGARDIKTIEGWDKWPGLRSKGWEYAYRHGEVFNSRHYYRAREIMLTMVILGTSLTDIQANQEAILSLLHTNSGTVPLQKITPSGTRETEVIALQSFDVSQEHGISRKMAMRLKMPYPFWHHVPMKSTSGQTSTFNLTNDGNAPINDMVITFTTAGTLTHDASGDYLTAADNGLVVNVGKRTAKLAGSHKDSSLSFNRPWWMQMEPGVNAFTVSGGGNVAIDFYSASFS